MNELLVQLSSGEQNRDAGSLSEPAAELLRVDNGDWTHATKLQHFCAGVFCCPNGIKETRAKLWSAILDPFHLLSVYVLSLRLKTIYVFLCFSYGYFQLVMSCMLLLRWFIFT
jgi:hypothetical protein